MARVPTYDNPQAQEIALPQARQQSIASPELFSGISGARNLSNMGSAISDFGDHAFKIATQIQEKEDVARTTDAEAELINRTTNFKMEASKREGLNAQGLPVEADDWWEKNVKELEDGLTSDRQKEAFRLIARKHQPSFRSNIGQHSMREVAAAEKAGLAAAEENIYTSAAADPSGANVSTLRDRLLSNVKAQSNGMPQDVLDRNKDIALNKLHSSVIQSLQTAAVDKPEMLDAAKAYFYANKKEINPKIAEQIETKLNEAGLDVEVQNGVDSIMQKGMSDDEAYDYIEKSYSGEKEKRFKQEFKTRKAERGAAKAQAEKEQDDWAWKTLAGGEGIKAIKKAGVWDRLDGKTQIQMQDFIRVRAERAEAKAKGKEFKVETDWKTYYELRMKSMRGSLSEGDLISAQTKLAPAQMEQILDIAQKGKGKDADVQLKDAATLTQQINSAADQLGLKGATRGEFESFMYNDINAEQKRGGSNLDYEARQKRIDHWLMEGEIPGNVWDTEGSRYELRKDKDFGKFKVPGESQFVEGKIYKDAKGNRARFKNGTWEPVK